MRLLIVAESMPSRHPQHGEGSSLMTWELLHRVPDDVDVQLAYFRTSPERTPDALRELCSTVRELPARTGASRYSYLASTAPSAAWSYSGRAAKRQVSSLAAQSDVVLLHGLRCGGLAPVVPVPFVLSEIDPPGYYFEDRIAAARGLRKASNVLNLRRTLRLERRLAELAAAWIVVSETDARAQEQVLQRPVLAIPNGVQLPTVTSTADRRAAAGPPTVCFMGTLDWPPNVLSVQRLTSVVMPRLLQQVPDARLLVAGRRPNPAVRECLAALGDHAELLEGFADVDDVFDRVQVMVFPDQEGGGLRNSVLETVVRGVPLVATPAALRGIDVLGSLGRDADTEDDLTAFVEVIAHLLLDPAAHARARQQVREVGARLPTWDDCARQFFEVLRGAATI